MFERLNPQTLLAKHFGTVQYIDVNQKTSRKITTLSQYTLYIAKIIFAGSRSTPLWKYFQWKKKAAGLPLPSMALLLHPPPMPEGSAVSAAANGRLPSSVHIWEEQRASDAADGSRRRHRAIGPLSSRGSHHRRGRQRRRVELRDMRECHRWPLRPCRRWRPSPPLDLGADGRGGAAMRPAVVVIVVARPAPSTRAAADDPLRPRCRCRPSPPPDLRGEGAGNEREKGEENEWLWRG